MSILSSAFEVKCLNAELKHFQASAVPVPVPDRVGPPSTNRGGNFSTPLSKIPVQKVKCDWLSFTSAVGIVPLKIIVSLLFPSVVMQNNDRGMKGYPESYTLSVDGVPIGLIGCGAAHGRDLVSISGKGCSLWQNDYYPWVLDCLQTAEAKITRIDLCMDFYKGELSYESALIAYYDGEFNPLKGGKKMPKLGKRGEEKDGGVNLGRTMYVGSMLSSKMARCYEKGLEVFSRLPDDFREACSAPGDLVYIDQAAPVGTIADQWFRVEIVYRSHDLDLALDMVMRRDEFFAGAYPFCARILAVGDGVRPDYLKPSEDIDNEKMFLNLKNGYGNAVHTWRACGYTDAQILDRVDTGVQNQRMVRAGILAKHQAVQDSDIPF